MSEFSKESLSALLDNEANELEIRRLLKEAENNPELLKTWQRMNLVHALLHDENVQHAQTIAPLKENFAEKVAQAVAAEPLPVAHAASQSNNEWAKSLTKLAIAASVALAFFLGMQTTIIQPEFPGSGITPVAQQTESPVTDTSVRPAINEIQLAESAVPQVDPEARQRLEDYIRSVSIEPEEPPQLQQLQDSPLYRLVNEIQADQ